MPTMAEERELIRREIRRQSEIEVRLDPVDDRIMAAVEPLLERIRNLEDGLRRAKVRWLRASKRASRLEHSLGVQTLEDRFRRQR